MFKKHINLSIIVTTIVLASCTQILTKGTKIYQYTEGVNSTVTEYEIITNSSATIKEVKDKGIEISNLKASTFKKVNEYSMNGQLGDWRGDLKMGSYYFPDKIYSSKMQGFTSTDFSIQAVNISFKNRYSTNKELTQSVKDSFPSTWSSGFSPALAVGYTLAKNLFNTEGSKKVISLTAGGFFGLGTEDINKDVTRAPIYTLKRKALTLNRGFYLNFGFQKWDIGYAHGWENATGPGSNSWIYQGRPFHGIIIGYDIVKLRD